MGEKNKHSELFQELKTIINTEQSKKVDSFIREFVRHKAFREYKGEEADAEAEKKSSRSLFNWRHKLSNNCVNGHIISFNKENRIFKLIFPDNSCINFSPSQNKETLKLLFPSGKIFHFELSLERNYVLKFDFSNYPAVIFIYNKEVFLFVIDTKKVRSEIIFCLSYSEEFFDFYAEKEFYKLLQEKMEKFKGRSKEKVKNISENEVKYSNVDPISMHVGLNILSLVDPKQGAPLVKRVSNIRKHLILEMGVVLPGVRLLDNLQLKDNAYNILIRDVVVASGELFVGKFLAIGPEEALTNLEGHRCSDPTYGMPAVWITEEDRSKAADAGCMIFDTVSVLATHITEVARTYAWQLLGWQDTVQMLNFLKKTHPFLVEEVYAGLFSTAEINAVLKNLLRERVSIRDLSLILETLGRYGRMTKDIDELSEYVRQALCLIICRDYVNSENIINIITLDSAMEDFIKSVFEKTDNGSVFTVPPADGEMILNPVKEEVDKSLSKGFQPVILCLPRTRLFLRRLTEKVCPQLTVLSYNEIATGVDVKEIGTLKIPEKQNIFSKVKKLISGVCQKINKTLAHNADKEIKEENEAANSKTSILEEEKTKDLIESVNKFYLLSEEDIDYICLRLDVERGRAGEYLLKYNDPMAAFKHLREELEKKENALQKEMEGNKELAEEEISKNKEDSNESSRGKKYELIKEEMASWLEKEIDGKIRKLIEEFKIEPYQAFKVLQESDWKLKKAEECLKGGNVKREAGEYIGILINDPLTWSKLEYIVKSVSCNYGEAFRALLECEEDEMSAVEVLKNKNKDNK